MIGKENFLVSVFRSADKLIIPVYQRNYDWKEEHCKRLFNDLIETIKNDRKTHFFGGIVSVNDPDGQRADWLIIDGQQRIITVNLLLLALANLLQEGNIVSTEQNLANIIVKKYLADEADSTKRKIKLKPIKGDADAFEKLWKNPDDYNQASNVTVNYTYFYKRIQDKELTADELFEAIERLQVIDISLKMPDDDPQLVFESLNSTGLELSEGDKIRNFILMGLSAKAQERYYKDYWNPIEIKAGHDKKTNIYDVSLFIRDFLSIKQRKITKINLIYPAFKEYALSTTAEPLLQEMLIYARRYEKLLNASSDLPLLNASINRLNRLGSSVTRPFLMEVLRLMEENVIIAEDAIKAFRIVESYLLRRAICDLPSNVLNKVFLTLYNDIFRLDGTPNDFINKMRYVLSVKKEKARFPDKEEFTKNIINKNVYKMSSDNKAYIFERLENGDSKEPVNIYERMDNGEYSIEHIMPQTMTEDWQDALGLDFEIIHDTWLHRLANLTLTGYNSEYRNNGFEKKCKMKGGFIDSGLRMNQYLARNTKWGLEELEKRAEYLTNEAHKLWPYVETNYTPPQRQFDEYMLNDDVTFAGRTILKYRFNNIESEVKNWKDMYCSVIGALHEKNKAILNYLADADNSIDMATHVSRTESSTFEKIDDNIYLLKKTDTQYKINLLQRFFTLYEEEPENLILVVK
ncbi:MAG: DUF262 domain-containing HNH endonuclease family protein [Candidatus Methanoplasma sp.]|jgi:uncharacterized protein with ParB-like and HNH nuclease domain|nr:DUF262 domain-containing HNH endonuclease family protein [Candidatus Methanoplasma sp.]